jgi:uncharacterized protein YidB (DUF937 family)
MVFKKGEFRGLLDEVLAMAGTTGAQQGQHASVLGAMMSLINSPQVGGPAGLQNMFQQGGLGNIISSSIGAGQNLPVSASQLQSVPHGGALERAAQQVGMDPSQLTGIMSSLLPHLGDKLTPNGQMPDASALQKMMQGLGASA